MHELLYRADTLYRQPDYVHVLLRVLTSLQLLSAVQQVEQLPAVYLVERHRDVQILIVLISQGEDVLGAEVVHAGTAVLRIPVHGVSFAAARLPIREAGHLGPHEGALHDRPYTLIVHLLVGGLVSDDVVELELMFVHVFGQVDFDSASDAEYLCSRMVISLLLTTSTMSCSLRVVYFLLRGRLRITTRIFTWSHTELSWVYIIFVRYELSN